MKILGKKVKRGGEVRIEVEWNRSEIEVKMRLILIRRWEKKKKVNKYKKTENKSINNFKMKWKKFDFFSCYNNLMKSKK